MFVSLADTDVMQTDGGTIEGFVGIGTQYTVPQGPSYALDIEKEIAGQRLAQATLS